MNVTVVTDVLGEENNGTTVACMNLIRFLRLSGDCVKVVCCDSDKKGTPGYYVCPVLKLGPIIDAAVKRNGVSLAKADKGILEEAIKDADIVHIMMPFSLGKAAAKTAVRLGIPFTAGFHVQAENFTSHVFMMNSRLANRLTYKVFYSSFFKYASAIHYPTEFIRGVFEKTIGKETNGYVISNGVKEIFKMDRKEKPEEYLGRFVILFTGRYSKEKSHDVLLKAVACSRHKESIQLIFAGAGPLHKKIEKKAKKLKINMPVMKFFSQEELVRVINWADLYCHPAEAEIEAIACLEAISCGLVPVIADSPRCATKAFARDGRNLFKCNDRRDLAAKIDYWIEHPEEKAECSAYYYNAQEVYKQSVCMAEMRDMLVKTAGIKEANEEKDLLLLGSAE